ncbi:MAG: TolB-like protein [Kiritimatiellia bacterium]|jgi:TolB-like protein
MLRIIFLFLLALSPSVALAGPNTLAVLYFKNQGNPDLEPLKVGLAQMLITDLQQTHGLKVVERSQLQSVMDELALGHSGTVDKKTAAKLGNLLGAEWLLMGGYFELAGTLRIDARLVNVETGEILHAQGRHGTTPEFMALEQQLAEAFQLDLAGRTGGTPVSVVPADGLPTPVVPSGTRSTPGEANGIVRHNTNAVAAAVAYSEGLIFLDNKDAGRARESFEKALTNDPDLQLAKAELASLDL